MSSLMSWHSSKGMAHTAWSYQPGALRSGHDLRLVNASLESAQAICAADNSCCGITFPGRSSRPRVAVSMTLKQRCELVTAVGGEVEDPSWNAWTLQGRGAQTFINAGTAGGTPHSFDCAARTFAWEFGKRQLGRRGAFRSLFDALQLQACNQTPPAAWDVWRPPALPVPSNAAVFVVRASRPAAPRSDAPRPAEYPSIAAALVAARSAPPPKYVLLRGGVHFLEAPLQLNAADGDLTIQNFAGEHAVVSGGKPLQVAWRPSPSGPAGAHVASLPSEARVPGLRLGRERAVRARFPNGNPLTSMRRGALQTWISLATSWLPPIPPATEPEDIWITADDWPGVVWPMSGPKGAPNGSVPSGANEGEGAWGAFTLGVGGACAQLEPPLG